MSADSLIALTGGIQLVGANGMLRRRCKAAGMDASRLTRTFDELWNAEVGLRVRARGS
jgi:hypothetical protein